MSADPQERHLDGIYIRIMRDGKYLAKCLTDCTWDEVEAHLIETTRTDIDGGRVYLLGTVKHLYERLRKAGDDLDLHGDKPG